MADYISREDILKKLKSWYSELEADKDKGYADELAENEGEREAIECCIAEIESIKAADVQPVKHGRWIWDSNAPHREHGAYKCSNCGCHSDFEENYCYNCGADMRGGEKND